MKMLSAGYVEAARDVTNMDTFDCLYHDVSDAWARANNNMPVSLGPSSGSCQVTACAPQTFNSRRR